ncbi:hypothetical protein D187_009949 [Cystobacter fuscus DSM 2262]|uniref:Uncharacterized protein n=1 Tax=Cystobacter fuscus (strain ATCC 25194 / DSM 2262 / NBRC 100088 / M29) TaxID=1242864 RepID=S9PG61_CYSF2|nr:hypothetical protein [Cystobacter fuscus]EPX62046.1 hypothetical protein D187_009949 [Cystobacter fuscus DSM 2262]
MDLNAKFLQDPVKFAQKHAIAPVGNLLSNPANLKHKGNYDATTSYYQVEGQNRVLYCSVTASGVSNGDAGFNTSKDQNIYSLSIAQAQATGSFPIYWLPWKANQIIRTTLTPSKKHHLPLLATAAFQEPHVFVTATVNGCSVFVEGSETEPTVYHANAGGTGGSIETPHGLIAKVSRMETVYKAFSHHAVKKTPGPTGRSLSAGRYMSEQVGGVSRAQDDARIAKQLGVNRNLAPITVINEKGKSRVRHIGDFKTITFGTVFGVRDPRTGAWTFYVQHRVRATHWKKVLRFGRSSNPNTWQQFDTWTDLTVQEFWPRGSGTVIDL